MMHNILNSFRVSLLRKSLAAGAVLAGTAAMPSAALAHHHGFHIDVDVPVPVPVVVAPAPCDGPRVWVEPVYRTVTERQWIEPVYQTVTERTWIPASVTSQTQRVYVPDQFAWRDVSGFDAWGHLRIYREQVLVTPAHYEDRQVGCVQVPGHYEDVPHQQLVCEGHWQDVQRQELVCAGHWETAAPAAPVCVEPAPVARLEFRLPF